MPKGIPNFQDVATDVIDALKGLSLDAKTAVENAEYEHDRPNN